MDPVEFIGHLLAHVPEPYENTARYFGAYANHFRHRMWDQGVWERPGQQPGNDRDDEGTIPFEEKTTGRPSVSWSRLIKKIWGGNPLQCPRCGKTMRLISLISPRQTDVIDRIIDHLNIRTPPRSPPPPYDPCAFTHSIEGHSSSAQVQHRMEPFAGYNS
jgi:hypothetical protein